MNASLFPMQSLLDLYRPDAERIRLAMRRQAAVFRGERPDQWPVLINGPLTPDQERIPNPNLKEQFHDADLMLCAQMRMACAAYTAGSDMAPSIRVNHGTGICLACVGLGQEVFEDKMPWLKRHLTRAEIANLTPDDIIIQGDFERSLKFMRRYQEVVGDRVPVYCLDTQGPFDLAHLMYGDEIFYAVLDDPPFVHHLMRLALELGIRAHRWCKEIAGEPANRHHHSCSLYAENMGIRICEDSTTIVGHQVIDEFCIPYTRKLAQAFGGAWVHYCGRNDYLADAICAIPEVRAVNFGHIPGHEQDYSFEAEMERCRKAHKVCFGIWPRQPGESGRQYLDRMFAGARQGCLVPWVDPALSPPDGCASAAEALAYWRQLCASASGC